MLLLELLPLKVLQVRGSDLIAPPHFSTGNVGYYIMISSVNPVVEWVNDWLLLIGMLDNLFFFLFPFLEWFVHILFISALERNLTHPVRFLTASSVLLLYRPCLPFDVG
jgi:hypothetical protein